MVAFGSEAEIAWEQVNTRNKGGAERRFSTHGPAKLVHFEVHSSAHYGPRLIPRPAGMLNRFGDDRDRPKTAALSERNMGKQLTISIYYENSPTATHPRFLQIKWNS
jgi:hypothetical protein